MNALIRHRGRHWTLNANPSKRVYGERLARIRGHEFRQWSARRSKLAAYLERVGGKVTFRPGAQWLYLGAAAGTTTSHVSDLLPEGRVVAVEKARRPFGDLVALATARQNLLPILADASRPETYAPLLPSGADILYQDIAQRDQSAIFVRNVERFLKPDGTAFLALKARSVDVATAPARIYRTVKSDLEGQSLRVHETVALEPWQQDHAMFVVRKQGAERN